MIAPLHHTYSTETTPIGTALDFAVATRKCDRCGAVLDQPCRTVGGRVTRDHAGRWGR